MSNRREFIGNISKAGVLGALSMGGVNHLTNGPEQLAARPQEGHIFLSQPYLQAPTTNSINILWITNKFCFSWVEFGEGNNLNNKAFEVTDGLVNAHNRVNNICLTHLKPNTKYSYRVVSKEIIDFKPYKVTYGDTIVSEPKTFQTIDPASEEVSWLVLNDIHDRPHSFKDLLQLNKNDPFDYVFLNGDMFDYQTDEDQLIKHLIKPCTDIFAGSTPFLFVRGNHETRGKFARNIVDYFASPSGKYYYSYQWGPVYNIVLDTGEDKPDETPVYAGIVDFDSYRKEQAAWLEKVMRTPAFKKSPFRVVMMHIPHYYSGDWHGTVHCRELFAPLFNKYKIDLFIAGHTHKYGIFDPVKGAHNYPIIIGGGPKQGNRTLIKIKANKQQINLQLIRDDGNEVGSYLVKKR